MIPLPHNKFKRALAAGQQQIGFWCSLPGASVAELLAGAGYDWLLFDAEHAPNEVSDALTQLQAAAGYDLTAIVRPASNDTVLIKRYLDLGAQTLLIPYVQSRAEAEAAVAAMHYPPRGVRGYSALTRATRYGRVAGYAGAVAQELCLLVQIETIEAVAVLEEIASVPGVDGVFIGPGDLAASMGLVGQLDHPEVVQVVETAIARIRACGKPAGILTANPAFARRCIALGTCFTAIGLDTGVLARGAEALLAPYR